MNKVYDIYKKVQRIQIEANKHCTANFLGLYKSQFRGKGLEFEDVREYQVGDEVNTIDWNIYARTNKPYVKCYREEREREIMIVFDICEAMNFSSHHLSKREYATEVAAILALSAMYNHDKVGLILFSSEVEKCILPDTGKNHILKLIHDMLYYPSKCQTKKNGDSLLKFLQKKTFRKKSSFFVFSDFFCSFNPTLLEWVAKCYDLILMSVHDFVELHPYKAGLLCVSDQETGKKAWVDFSSSSVKKVFCERREKIAQLKKFVVTKGAKFLSFVTNELYMPVLKSFFVEKKGIYS